ncbi:FadR/GntR family transcriptional regulator [Franzmannia qiaohouensis]|uniref:GntR family transcriptional regulator n=1 Tax=Franzmannia qiaohouensis TaxID=1329370 RepID=A0ABU1HK28_9GAMM|nr:FCD domain-containing protein [Halomonas qiaohouensis]MDR5907836.1 GntR family transcriptional regulator [Halomonas qiaohouensis]
MLRLFYESRIQNLIASRRLKSGEKLATERELSATLNVGRGAVREGIKLLAALDIVEVRQGSGTFVKKDQSLVLLDASHLGSEERREMLAQAHQTRKIIDCAVAELAALSVSEESLIKIRDYLEDSDREPMLTRLACSIDLTFESMLGDATGNAYLRAVQKEAHRYFQTAWESTGYMPRPAEERSQQHWAIYNELAARNSKGAKAMMEAHLNLRTIEKEPNDR